MIRFFCKRCGHKIGFQDEQAGRKCKCPRCDSAMVVPRRSTIIDFHCENCGQKISVSKAHAGRKGKCPKCEHLIVVPRHVEHTGPNENGRAASCICSNCDREIQFPEGSPGKLIECPYCGCYTEVSLDEIPVEKSDVSAKDLREDVVSGLSHEEMQILGGEIRVKETEQTGERKLPWLVDIFLYPATTSGMIHVAVFLIAPILIDLLYRFVLSHAGPYGALLSFILYMFLIVYACRYFSDCVRDSAAGGVRAPEILGSTFGKDEMLEQYITMLACYAFFFGPVTFYRGYIHFSNAQVNNAIFWPLLAYGLFFFPMGILAVVMFDSINGLNPILLICSIVSTFFQYCGLLFFIAALCVLRIQILTLSIRQRWGTFAKVVPNLVLIWLLFVAAHIIGRFYWRYQEKLNWEA